MSKDRKFDEDLYIADVMEMASRYKFEPDTFRKLLDIFGGEGIGIGSERKEEGTVIAGLINNFYDNPDTAISALSQMKENPMLLGEILDLAKKHGFHDAGGINKGLNNFLSAPQDIQIEVAQTYIEQIINNMQIALSKRPDDVEG